MERRPTSKSVLALENAGYVFNFGLYKSRPDALDHCIPSKEGRAVMHHHPRPYRPLSAIALLVVLSGCSPISYENSLHTSYGAAEFKSDLARCRIQSATAIATIQGYYVQSGTGVDDVRTNACMATHGWQQAPPSVSGIMPL